MSYPCDGRVVRGVLISRSGKSYHAENTREWNGDCPRRAGGLKSGTGYDLCRDLCKTAGHVEQQLVEQAGDDAKESNVFLFGHDYCCSECVAALVEAEVGNVTFVFPPEQGWPAGTKNYGLYWLQERKKE